MEAITTEKQPILDLTGEYPKISGAQVLGKFKLPATAASTESKMSSSGSASSSVPGGVFSLFEEYRKGRGKKTIKDRAEAFRKEYNLTAPEVKFLASVAKKMAFNVEENKALKDKVRISAADFLEGSVHKAWEENMATLNTLLVAKHITKTSWAVFIVAYQEEFVAVYNNTAQFAYHHEVEHTFYFKTYYAGASWETGVADWDWRFRAVKNMIELLVQAGGAGLPAKERGIHCSDHMHIPSDAKPLTVLKKDYKSDNFMLVLSVPILIDPQSLFNCFDAKTDPNRKVRISVEIAKRMYMVIQLCCLADNRSIPEYDRVTLVRVPNVENGFLTNYFEAAKYLRAFMRSFKIAKWGKSSGAAAQRDFLTKNAIEMSSYADLVKLKKPSKNIPIIALKTETADTEEAPNEDAFMS